ncbi:MAG: nucleotidyltransferase domain-containing protein [Blastocatellia bacterium]
MSKQTANGTSTIKPAKVKAPPARKKRSAKANPETPIDVEKWMQEYHGWKQSYETPAKRRAYIRKLCRCIAEEFKPEKIILFGSHAYGKPTEISDVDLLVVMPYEGSCFQQATKISRYLKLPIPMDLLVHTPEYIRYRLEIGDRFIQEILDKGRIMYEGTHDRMD